MTTINPLKDGPYLVSGITSLTRLSDNKSFAVEGKAALCRCGASKNKPFCDGAHASVGFSGEKTADRTPDRQESYDAPGITIHDNRGACAHAGKCTAGLPVVFRTGKEPFIDPAAASPDEIAAVVKQCPAGALSFSLAGKEYRFEEEEDSIVFEHNGPYLLEGSVELEDTELFEGAGGYRIALCRCGKSKNKPFCNGAHWDAPFDEDTELSE